MSCMFFICSIDLILLSFTNMQNNLSFFEGWNTTRGEQNLWQNSTFFAGETLVAAWLTTDGIILAERNAEWDTHSLSRVVTAWASWLKWGPGDWNS